MFEIERIAEDLSKVVAGMDPACLEGRDAARLTEVAAEGEKLFGAAKVLLAQRAVETRAWARSSRAATPEQWLAEASGCTEGAAREALATAQRLTSLPATAEQLRAGGLSVVQAAQVSAGATTDPTAEQRLLLTAKRSGASCREGARHRRGDRRGRGASARPTRAAPAHVDPGFRDPWFLLRTD